eukprot:jgi/Chlat1/7276/Chrsp58S06909
MDDVVALVDYLDSDEEGACGDGKAGDSLAASPSANPKSNPKPNAAQALPALPRDIINLYTADDASAKHQGRKRSFAHVEGNFAVHVYIPALLLPRERERIQALTRDISAAAPGILPMEAVSVCHVSLSRTIAVRYPQIDSLVAALRRNLRRLQRFSLELDVNRLVPYVNDDRSRSFLAIDTSDGTAQVCSMVACVDAAFKLHGLPTFYENPRPHVSVAWALGDHEKQWAALCAKHARARDAAVRWRDDMVMLYSAPHTNARREYDTEAWSLTEFCGFPWCGWIAFRCADGLPSAVPARFSSDVIQSCGKPLAELLEGNIRLFLVITIDVVETHLAVMVEIVCLAWADQWCLRPGQLNKDADVLDSDAPITTWVATR